MIINKDSEIIINTSTSNNLIASLIHLKSLPKLGINFQEIDSYITANMFNKFI